MSPVNRWLLPDGIEEVLPPQAGAIEQTRRNILDLFERWGYTLVMPPHIDYLESLLSGAGKDLDARTFKVIDPCSGRLMGFRADITPQVARIDAHALKRQGPSRLCYMGTVLHATPRTLSTARSALQLGAELYGDASPASDIEVISLLLSTLCLVKVPEVHLDLGHVGIYRSLIATADLDPKTEQQLFDALQRKAQTEVQQLTVGLPAPLAKMITALTELCGEREILDLAQAALVEAPHAVHQALDELIAIADVLSTRYPELPLYFDLGELRGYHYHTGVVFAAFLPKVGQAIAQGGRYDNIGADFGRARPATGFSADLKTLVTYSQKVSSPPRSAIWAPDAHDLLLWQKIEVLRQQGATVIQALPGQTSADTCDITCDQELYYDQGAWTVRRRT